MPARKFPLAIDQYYHIFNRGINKQPIFLGLKDYQRALDLLDFYSFATVKLRFSKFLLLPREERTIFWEKLRKEKNKLVEIVAFCLMPNHFHFQLQQKKDNGISKFMATFQNSYTRYFNTKYKKIGPILQGQCKAVRVEDDEQFIHLTRYIHLNPYTSYIVKDKDDLETYPWSSFPEYIGKVSTVVCNKDIIVERFKDITNYRTFVFNQADYQRELGKIKHLTLEES